MTQERSTHRIAVEGELTIFTAAELRQQLLDALDIEPGIEIDLSKVCDMDSAGIQLIVATKNEATLRNKYLHFTGHSPAVSQVLALCNLTDLLNDPELSQRGTS